MYRMPLPLPDVGLVAVNVYIIEGDDGLTLIDAGWALDESRRLIDTGLASIGRSKMDIRRILVTHVHADQYTQAVTLRRDTGCVVALGAGDRASLEDTAAGVHPGESLYPLLRSAGAGCLADELIADGYGDDAEPTDWEPPDFWLRSEDRFHLSDRRVIRAIGTPGDTCGHHVFLDHDAGLMFTGDHILPRITPSIGYEAALAASPLSDYLSSLSLMQTLPDTKMLPAHGSPTASTRERVEELIEHHDDRLLACIDAVVDAGSSATDVARRLTWSRQHRSFDELNAVNRCWPSPRPLLTSRSSRSADTCANRP